MLIETCSRIVLCTVTLTFACFNCNTLYAGDKSTAFKDSTTILRSLAPGYNVAYPLKTTRSIDLDIKFKINSSNLSQNSLKQLDALGEALKDKRFSKSTIIIAGHTDASGSTASNKKLSQERAKVVASYLRKHFKILSNRITSTGYGDARLKNILQPKSSINRRVEIIVKANYPSQQKTGSIKW